MSYSRNIGTLAPPPTLPIKDVAARLGVHENTVRNWVDRGLLDGYRTPTGRRKVRLDDVERLEREMYGVPVRAAELDESSSAPPQVAEIDRAAEHLP
jgi:excisionase family DNA binding protein